MSDNHLSPLAEILRELLARQGLRNGVDDLIILNRAWLWAAGPTWQGISWVAGWRSGYLRVLVTTPAAATRLRFEAKGICERFYDLGWKEVEGIQPKVQPEREQRSSRRSRRYSEEAAAAVAEGARQVPDRGARQALEQLARHLAQPPR